jgi:hypothetical protein
LAQLDALARTLAIELPVGWLCLWLFARNELRQAKWRAPVVLLAASLLTHPFAWWGNQSLLGVVEFWPRVAMVELAVVLVEATLLRVVLHLRWPGAALASLAMNAASFGLGLWWMWR